MAVISTEGQPGDRHRANLDAIIEQWPVIWPEVRDVLTELMVSYGREKPDWKDVSCLYLGIPAVPISTGEEWSIGIVFSVNETLWSLPFRGWAACPNQAQAIY